jgi:hypothetical protein
MTDENVISEVHDSYGGFVKVTRNRSGRQDMHVWNLKGMKALDLLEKMRPHLVIERRQALTDILLNSPILRSTARGSGSSKVRHTDILFQHMRERNAERLPLPPELPSSSPSSADIAYLAGILDGEGHITPTLKVQVASTDPELLAWLRSRFGGGVYSQRPGKGAQRAVWAWHRAPTGFTWAAEVAAHMLVERKRERVAAAHGFQRQSPPAPSLAPTPYDDAYLELRKQGLLRAVAVRESGISLTRARVLDGTKPNDS